MFQLDSSTTSRVYTGITPKMSSWGGGGVYLKLMYIIYFVMFEHNIVII